MSSKDTTPLHSSAHPWTGWEHTVRADWRSGADGSGHCGVCPHIRPVTGPTP
ncbi:hypothetical protein ACIQNG_34135 [Streptomyces sp. NPDC091377]|uniref:hypothetical protein n=1 Tax=Streptomyces sp. NPDC091377 TaxID=3365995 RepID=UPI0038299AC2